MAALTTAEKQMKQTITKNLEDNGVLGVIKAKLRAAVLQALHDTSTNDVITTRAQLLKSQNTKDVLCMIAQFLKHYELQETLAVLVLETSCSSEKELAIDREKISKTFDLDDSNEKRPLLMQLLSPRSDPKPVVHAEENPLPKQSIFIVKEHSPQLPEVVPPPATADDDIESEIEASMDDYSQTLDESTEDTAKESKPTQEKLESIAPLQSIQEIVIDTNHKPKASFLTSQEEDNDRDEPTPQDEEARLSSLDATLKAMEAEDQTGTLKKLKASLQNELDHKSDDDQYGSDFEEDFEEEIASDVEEAEDEGAQSADDAFKISPSDKRVTEENALDDYDYVEDVELP